jgi:chitinase
MNKLFILSFLSSLMYHQLQAAVVTVHGRPVTVTASATSSVAKATATASSSTSSSSSSSSSGSINVSQDDFIKAWTNGKQYLPDSNIAQPTTEQYKAFINNAGTMGGITSKTELAMFLAQIMWESGGLIYKSELACQTDNCAGSYQDSTGLPGKYYYGRGYIQLTWGANYKAASLGLYNDDRLLQNPDQVATNEDYAWGVSFWFWKNNVKPFLSSTNSFGLSTNAINGALECSGSNTDKAKKRYQIYTEVLKVFEASATPVEGGCYN